MDICQYKRLLPHRNRLRNISAAVQRHLPAHFLLGIWLHLGRSPHLIVSGVSLCISSGLVPGRSISLAVRCLGNITAARHLTARITVSGVRRGTVGLSICIGHLITVRLYIRCRRIPARILGI